jgi:cell division protein FtsB
MAGILMIAVQALEKQNRDLRAENTDLKARLERLERLTSAKEALAQR